VNFTGVFPVEGRVEKLINAQGVYAVEATPMDWRCGAAVEKIPNWSIVLWL
jgi:hypothetical protein